MPKNHISDLRNHLFEVIEMLKDGDLEVKKAETIAKVGQVIVNSAKVEVQFQKLVGKGDSDFLTPKQVNTLPGQNPFALTGGLHNKCTAHAAQFGHSKNIAQACENYSVGCPNCPLV